MALLHLSLVLLVSTVQSAMDIYCDVSQYNNSIYDVSNSNISDIDKTELNSSIHGDYICVKCANNMISTLDNDTFSLQWKILSLDLSYNLLIELPSGLFSMTHRLQFLYITHNQLFTLPGDLFKNLYFIRVVDLSYNNISSIPREVFNNDMPYLESVVLKHNSLTSYEPFSYVYPGVRDRVVDLQWNMISHFTNEYGIVIKQEEHKNVYEAVFTDLRHNNLRVWDSNAVPQYFENNSVTLEQSVGLMLINIGDNPWNCDCKMYPFASEFRDSMLKYTRNDYVMIKCYDPPQYRDKSILFDLNPNDFVCNVTKDCPTGCQCSDIPEEQILKVDCTKTGLTRIPAVVPVSPYGNLDLQMNGNSIYEIQNVTYAKHIVKLSARNTGLKHIADSVIEAIASKDNVNMSLDFRDNRLKTLPSSLHKIKYQYVSVSGNNFECSCDMLWMVEWVNLAPVTAFKEITCTFKGDTYMITDVNKDILECIDKGSIVLVIVLSCVVGVVVVIGITVKRCPYETKVLLYKIFRIHPADKYIVDKTDDKNYDLYVCYDEEDPYLRQWVKRVLVRQLEYKKPFYKLCLSGRDLKAGHEADSRLDLIEESKRMLIILSEGIENNEWCTYEAHHSECLEDNSGRIIYMLYDEAAKTLVCQETWKSRISGRRCFTVGERMMWSKLRYELPQKKKRFWL